MFTFVADSRSGLVLSIKIWESAPELTLITSVLLGFYEKAFDWF